MSWPMVPLSELLSRSETWVRPEPDQVYKQVTIRLWGKGLKLRGNVIGTDIGSGRRLQVTQGQFILSRIDARNGAFGVVTPELDGALVSNDFPAFDINHGKIAPEFLEWYSKTSRFVGLCRRASEGSTNRVRLKEDVFVNLQIPLPPLKEQQQIVSQLARMQAMVDERRSALAAVETDLGALLAKAFKIAIEGANSLPMEELAPLVRRPVDIEPDEAYPELGVRSFGRGVFHKPDIKGSAITWQKLFRVHEGDLVFSNIKAWEGAFAVAEARDDGRVGSHRYLTCVPNSGLATSTFICFYLHTREGAQKVADASPGSADRNRTLGQKALGAITVPVPSIEKQHWFDSIQSKVREIREIRSETAADIDALLPSMLYELFGEVAPAASKRISCQ